MRKAEYLVESDDARSCINTEYLAVEIDGNVRLGNAERNTNTKTDRQTDRQTGRQTETGRQRQADRDRQTDKLFYCYRSSTCTHPKLL